jgi:ATP-binding cassette subfamily A (ABC1) protein 1
MLFSNVTIGTIGAIAVFILRISPSMIIVGDFTNYVLKIFPNFTITNSIIYDAAKGVFNASRIRLLDDRRQRYPDIGRVTLEPMDLGNTGGDLVALAIHCVFGLFMVLVFEIGTVYLIKIEVCCRRYRVTNSDSSMVPDDDVVEEEVRVSNLDSKECLVKVQGLRKIFKGTCRTPVVAIQGTSFAVDKGECFALLGINGAGKTTTFKSLIRDVIPTAGKLTVLGYDINREFDKARHFIGYCPQHDTIFDMLTVKEHLEFQAVVKGIP